MISRWGEDSDDELKALQKREKIHVGFVWNMSLMSKLLIRLDEETAEWDNQYPKSELWKMWGSIMVIMLPLLILTKGVLMLATLLFLFFFGRMYFQIAKVWKRFGYSLLQYWLLTIAGLAVEETIAYFVQTYILKI